MPFKDADRQKQAVRDAVKRHRESKGITKGITDEGITQQGIADEVGPAIPSVIPTAGTLTKEEIASYVKGLSAIEARTILDGWADGNGTSYQQDLALTGRAYN